MKKIKILIWVTGLLGFSANGQKYNVLPDTISLCAGDTASIEIRQEFGSQAAIRWSTPQGAISNTKRIRASAPGKYFIRITPAQSNLPLVDSTVIKTIQRPRPMLADTVLCRGRSLQLDAGNPGMRYLWSTGETSQRIRAGAPGRYWVKVMNGRCHVSDTARVKAIPEALPMVAPEATFCLSDESKVISSKAGTAGRITWNTGAVTPSIAVTREGVYAIRLESAGCGMYSDSIRVKFRACDCEMMIPNSFTPNEDNRNDYFFPVLQCEYSYFNLTITDRWGNNVFSTNTAGGKWDGRFKGNLCPEDIYVYRIESMEKGSDRKQVRTGQISLFR